jgi:hypothetical protein
MGLMREPKNVEYVDVSSPTSRDGRCLPAARVRKARSYFGLAGPLRIYATLGAYGGRRAHIAYGTPPGSPKRHPN